MEFVVTNEEDAALHKKFHESNHHSDAVVFFGCGFRGKAFESMAIIMMLKGQELCQRIHSLY